MEPPIGKTLTHYRVLEQIGAGGMGLVYRAHDERLERDVALKVLPSGLLADEIARKRFRKEALALSRLNHPSIATIHDFDTQDGTDFLVMEYVSGETLGEKLRDGPLAEKEVVRLGIELAGGLAAAHMRGVIHRDLKPGNIRLTLDGRLKILDFGLAKLTQRADNSAETLTLSVSATEGGAHMGTLPYMAPEQLGGKGIDARSDIWAAGLVLYELATARRVFAGASSAQVIAAILGSGIPLPSRLNRQLSPGLDNIISKCLERDPDSRYQSARELAVDLRRLGTPQSMQEVPRIWLAKRRMAIVAGMAIVIVAGALAWNQGWLQRLHQRSPGPAKKDWILVADFDGPAGDPELAMATREFLSAELDQSELVATVQRDQIRLALEKAGKPPGTRVDGGLAKELAYRGAVRAVLEGKIDRLGNGYSVVLRVVDAESPKVILTEVAVAKDQNGLVPALSRLSRKLRNQLGERRAAIRATRDFDIVATPSFEAYKLFLQGQRTLGSGSSREAIPVMRDALALDPDFAIAWWGLGTCFQNIGQTDSARVAFDEALRRPQRLTATDRLNIEASRAMASEDLTGALIRFERILRDDPTNIAALINGGVTLVMLGRFQEALQNHRKAGRASPFGPGQVLRSNEVVDLLSLGRIEDARKAARYLRGPQARTLPTYIEIAAHNWAAAESVATAALTETDLEDELRRELQLNLASAQAGRGALEAAASTLVLAEGSSHRGAPSQDMARRARLMLSIVSRGAIPLPADVWAGDHSIATVVTRGLRAANAGDGPGARRLWNEARTRSSAELTGHGVALALLEARVDGISGKWREAVRTLLPIASQPVEIGAGWHPGGISVVRWFLADAYEKLGQPDSAAIYLERVVSEAASSYQEGHLRGIIWPFAHWRLVMLYSRMGRIEDARRHWQTFNETFTRPDHDLKPLIEEARSEMVEADGAAHRSSGITRR